MTMLTLADYLDVKTALFERGYREDYTWAENVTAPTTPEDFAREYVWIVLNSGMKNTVARKIMDRVWPTLLAGGSAHDVFRHEGKATGIDEVWQNREELFGDFQKAPDLLIFCRALPWIGPITQYHLAKNYGADVAKPDRWLMRLVEGTGEDAHQLCARLADASGDRIATVDLMLWRACAIGILQPAGGQP